jgi:hypothetical protein
MQISVVCGSRAKDKELLLRFLNMLDLQTYRDFDINIVCDRNFREEEENEFMDFFKEQNLKVISRTKFFTNNNSDFNPNH